MLVVNLCVYFHSDKYCLWYLKHKLFPSEDGNGVKVSLTDVWAVFGSGYFGGTRWWRRRRSSRLGACSGNNVRR